MVFCPSDLSLGALVVCSRIHQDFAKPGLAAAGHPKRTHFFWDELAFLKSMGLPSGTSSTFIFATTCSQNRIQKSLKAVKEMKLAGICWNESR